MSILEWIGVGAIVAVVITFLLFAYWIIEGILENRSQARKEWAINDFIMEVEADPLSYLSTGFSSTSKPRLATPQEVEHLREHTFQVGNLWYELYRMFGHKGLKISNKSATKEFTQRAWAKLFEITTSYKIDVISEAFTIDEGHIGFHGARLDEIQLSMRIKAARAGLPAPAIAIVLDPRILADGSVQVGDGFGTSV